MTTYEVSIEPLDPLLFGDNRSARAGEDHWRRDQDPLPATFYGALGARIANVAGAHGERDWEKVAPVLGPFSADPDAPEGAAERSQLLGYALADAEGRTWFPKPGHLRIERLGASQRAFVAHDLLIPADEGELACLSSLPEGERPLVSETGRRPPAHEAEDDLRVGASLLGAVLAGGGGLAGRAVTDEVRASEDFYRGEARLGLAVDNARNTAREGHLFSRPYRRFRSALGDGAGRPWRSAGYTAWYRVRQALDKGEEGWNGVGFLGGDRRRIQLAFALLVEGEGAEHPLGDLRAQAASAAEGPSQGFFLYLLTPSVAEAGGFAIDGRRPVGSATGKAFHASGWYRAREEQGPRALVTLVPAGSVYFFDWSQWSTLSAPTARREWVERRWLEPVTARTPCSGLGRALVGVW